MRNRNISIPPMLLIPLMLMAIARLDCGSTPGSGRQWDDPMVVDAVVFMNDTLYVAGPFNATNRRY